MSATIKVVSLPARDSLTATDVTVTAPTAGSGWVARGMIPFADKQGPAAAVLFDDDGSIVFSQGISSEDTSTGVTAGTNETAFTNYVRIPADTLRAGDRIRIRAKTFCVATHTTDTLALKMKLAAASGLVASTLVVSSTAAVDVANSDVHALQAALRVVAIGAAATAKFNGFGYSFKTGASAAFLGTAIDDDTSVATNAAIDVGVTYTWSVSDASNQVRIKELFVEVVRPKN